MRTKVCVKYKKEIVNQVPWKGNVALLPPYKPWTSKLHLWLLITYSKAIYYWNHVILLETE